MGKLKVTVRYSGDLQEARQVKGEVWFAVKGRAVLSHHEHHRQLFDGYDTVFPAAHVTASFHVVPRWSVPGWKSEVKNGNDNAHPSKENPDMLLRAVQTASFFAPVTALPAGIHVMCHVGRTSKDDGNTTVSYGGQGRPISSAYTSRNWSALWKDLWADVDELRQAERLGWQTPCLRLLHEAATSLGVTEIASVSKGVGSDGWARVRCEKSSSPLCTLASGGDSAPGDVMWRHLATEAAEGSVAERMLAVSGGENINPAFASVLACVAEDNQVSITAQAHGVLASGALSGYSVGPTQRNAKNEPSTSSDEDTDDEGTDFFKAEFVDDSLLSAVTEGRWFGAATMEELPGGGLHRHVPSAEMILTNISLICHGVGCFAEGTGGRSFQDDGDHELCTVLLSQHVPQEAYIDIDEVKARHSFDLVASSPTWGNVVVETFKGQPIDVELPASVSSQHLVSFKVLVGLPRNEDKVERTTNVHLELTLPVHLRYPDPACKRRGEDCEHYAWVEVPPPVVGVRCGGAVGTGKFASVLPITPPTPVVLRVPRGILWHRDLVVWSTIGVAVLGMLYTMCTLCTLPADAVGDGGRKRRSKNHID